MDSKLYKRDETKHVKRTDKRTSEISVQEHSVVTMGCTIETDIQRCAAQFVYLIRSPPVTPFSSLCISLSLSLSSLLLSSLSTLQLHRYPISPLLLPSFLFSSFLLLSFHSTLLYSSPPFSSLLLTPVSVLFLPSHLPTTIVPESLLSLAASFSLSFALSASSSAASRLLLCASHSSAVSKLRPQLYTKPLLRMCVCVCVCLMGGGARKGDENKSMDVLVHHRLDRIDLMIGG